MLMRKFINKILFFILPVMLLIYPIDYLISNYISESEDHAMGETKVWKDIYSGKINSGLVVYGSSRAWVQFSSKMIEDSLNISTYNLGIDGHNFKLQYFRHKELLRFNKKPKKIIMSVDIFTLQKKTDLYNHQQFLPFMLWNESIKDYTSSYTGFSTYDFNIPLYRYKGSLNTIKTVIYTLIRREPEIKRIKGYSAVVGNWNNDFYNAKSKNDFYEIKIDSATVNLFEKFINECKNNDIELSLVFSPEFIEGQHYVRNRKELISKYQNLANKYNLQFLDYSNSEICFQKQYYYNAQHLNKNGSELFTKLLIKDLKVNEKMNGEFRNKKVL